MSDRDLCDLLWGDDAYQELKTRMTEYPPEEREELARLLSDREELFSSASPPQLVGTLTWESLAPLHAARALQKRYEAGTPEDRQAIEELFVDRALQLSADAGTDSGDEDAQVAYAMYMRTARYVFPEAVVIPMLKAFYLDWGAKDGVHGFLRYILDWYAELGEPTARALAMLFDTYKSYPERMWAEATVDGPEVEAEIRTALGRCGSAGLAVLETIGWDTYEGVAAVGAIGTSRARDLLIDRYTKLDPAALGQRARVLLAMSQRLYANDEQAKAFLRRELPQYLVLPHAGYHAATLQTAVIAACQTGDPLFLPALQRLDVQIGETGFANAPEADTLPPDEMAREEKQVQQQIAGFEEKLQKQREPAPAK